MREKGEIQQLSESGQPSGRWSIGAILWFLPGAPLLFVLSDLLWNNTGVTGAAVVVWLLVWIGLIVMAYRESPSSSGDDRW
jgi:hypothetical protein